MKHNGTGRPHIVPKREGAIDKMVEQLSPPTQQQGPDPGILEGASAFGMWCLLERVVGDERTPGGIIRPDSARQTPAWIVRAVGEQVTIPVKVGDYVAWDGTRVIKGGGKAYAYAMQGQIMGRINPDRIRKAIVTVSGDIGRTA